MEGERFDHLTRHLGQGRTRRTALSLLAGLLGGSLSAQLAPRPVAAACRRLNQSCTKKRPRIGKRRKCCAGLVCRNKRCRIKECSVFLGCGEDRGCCDGKCVDLQTDLAHCGGCGNACPDGAKCVDGSCRSNCKADGETCQSHLDCCDPLPWYCVDGTCSNICGPELTWCDDNCVNLNFDATNCGSCGRNCGPDMDCHHGKCCVPGQCCADYGEACSSAAECCDSLDSCIGGVCCKPNGHRCSLPEECCNGVCTSGQCQPPCVPYGQACASASDCCLLNDGSHIPCSGGLCRFN